MIHRHRWELVNAQADLYRHGWDTELLYVCAKCGKPRAERLAGRWTLADLSPPASAPPASTHPQPRRSP